MQITIEKNVPIPEERNRNARPKLPLADMEIGDSIFVPAAVRETWPKTQTHRFQEGRSIRFHVRWVPKAEQDQTGWRIWRIADAEA